MIIRYAPPDHARPSSEKKISYAGRGMLSSDHQQGHHKYSCTYQHTYYQLLYVTVVHSTNINSTNYIPSSTITSHLYLVLNKARMTVKSLCLRHNHTTTAT
jgi:hypothetical protein